MMPRRNSKQTEINLPMIFADRFFFKKNKIQNNSGVILITVLWILVILSLIAFGVSRMTRMELSMARYYHERTQARYLAWAGIHWAIREIKKDSEDAQSNQFDSLVQCGIKLDKDQTLKDIFQKNSLGEGYFKISYEEPSAAKGSPEILGFSDEERKLNLNAVTQETYPILANLISSLNVDGLDETKATQIAASVVDWIDTDDQITQTTLGAEDDFYQHLTKPYHCKNAPFDSLEELLLVKGMTTEIFNKLKDYVTIFPRLPAQGLLINLDTASAPVIFALAKSYSGAQTNTTSDDARNLAQKIIVYRSGDDQIPMTQDDHLVDMNSIGLNEKEKVIFLGMAKNVTKVSHFIRVRCQGFWQDSSVGSTIEAVIDRERLKIVYWKKE